MQLLGTKVDWPDLYQMYHEGKINIGATIYVLDLTEGQQYGATLEAVGQSHIDVRFSDDVVTLNYSERFRYEVFVNHLT